MHRAVVWVGAAAAVLLVVLAFHAYGQKVDQLTHNTKVLNVLTHERADSQCRSARQNRKLWGELEPILHLSTTYGSAPTAHLIDEIHGYVASTPASCEPVNP